MKKFIPLILGIIVVLAVIFALATYEKEPRGPIDVKTAVITLERTVCFGFCPAYKLTIKGDGTITYEGTQFVKDKGVRTGTITEEQMKKLIDGFLAIDYFLLNDKYDAPVTDLPTTITSITANGLTKQILNYYGGPAELEALEEEIDAAVNSKQWIGTCTGPDTCE